MLRKQMCKKGAIGLLLTVVAPNVEPDVRLAPTLQSFHKDFKTVSWFGGPMGEKHSGGG